MNDIGERKGGGFAPSAPTAEDLLQSLGLGSTGGGWSALNKDPAAPQLDGTTALADLQKCFAQVSTPAGQRMIDAIVEQTLRRSPYLIDDKATLEQQTAYGLKRMGQNGITTWILSMIHAGQTPRPPAKKKKGRK